MIRLALSALLVAAVLSCQTAATMGGAAGGAALGAAVGGPGGAAAGAVGGALGGRAMAEELEQPAPQPAPVVAVTPDGTPILMAPPAAPAEPFSLLGWLLSNLEALVILGLVIWFMPPPHTILARLREKWRAPAAAQGAGE